MAEADSILKIAGVFLAIIIPAIIAYFQFRRELMKSQTPANVGAVGLSLLGGALASKDAMIDYIEALRDHTAAVNREGAAVAKLAEKAEAIMEAERTRVRLLSDAVDELRDMRKAIDDIAAIIGRRDK